MPAIWEMVKPVGQAQPASSPQMPPTSVPAKYVAVIIPHTGEVITEWALNLRNIQYPPNSQVFLSRGMPIDVTRDQLAKDIVAAGFEWLFFLDSDVILPPDTIVKLLSHNLPLVSGVYDAKKKEGFFPAMWVRTRYKVKDEKTGQEVEKEGFAALKEWKGRLIQVDVTGAGCLLVHRSVFDKIRAKTDLPFFFWSKERSRTIIDKMNLPDPLMGDVSEDFWFNMLAKHYAGIPTVVDTDIRCGHIATLKIDRGSVTIPAV